MKYTFKYFFRLIGTIFSVFMATISVAYVSIIFVINKFALYLDTKGVELEYQTIQGFLQELEVLGVILSIVAFINLLIYISFDVVRVLLESFELKTITAKIRFIYSRQIPLTTFFTNTLVLVTTGELLVDSESVDSLRQVTLSLFTYWGIFFLILLIPVFGFIYYFSFTLLAWIMKKYHIRESFDRHANDDEYSEKKDIDDDNSNQIESTETETKNEEEGELESEKGGSTKDTKK